MKKEYFEELDLRKQLTEEIKNAWYYKERKWGLRINKHSVVFDGIKFELKYMHNVFYGDPDFPNEESQGCAIVTEDGKAKYDLYEYDGIFDNEDKYCGNPKYILKAILIYIANTI